MFLCSGIAPAIVRIYLMYWNMRPQHNLCYYSIIRQDITTSVPLYWFLQIGFLRKQSACGTSTNAH